MYALVCHSMHLTMLLCRCMAGQVLHLMPHHLEQVIWTRVVKDQVSCAWAQAGRRRPKVRYSPHPQNKHTTACAWCQAKSLSCHIKRGEICVLAGGLASSHHLPSFLYVAIPTLSFGQNLTTGDSSYKPHFSGRTECGIQEATILVSDKLTILQINKEITRVVMAAYQGHILPQMPVIYG